MSMRAITFTKQSSTGVQVVSGLGFRPKWVLLLWNGCTSVNSIAEGFALGYGAAAFTGYGEGQGCHYSALDDGPASVNPNGCRIDRYTSIFVKASPAASGTPTLTDEAVLLSCDDDGFRLNWTTNSGSADLILAICGTHPQAAMDNVSLFLGSPAAVTDLGFAPTALLGMIKRTDCVGTLCATSLASGSSSANDMGGDLGFVDQNDTNAGVGWNNVASGFLSGWKSTQDSAGPTVPRIVRFLGVDGFNGASNDYLKATLDSDGYSFSGFASATPTWIQSFLALGRGQSAVGHQTGSGTVSPGFTPALAIILSNVNDSNVADVSIGVFDGTDHYAVTASAFLSGFSNVRTAREFSSGVAARVFNAPAATAASTTTKQTVTAAFGSGSITFTASGSSNEFLYLLLEDVQPSAHNLLTGQSHTVSGSDNVILAGVGGTVTGDRNALFPLRDAGSPSPEIDGNNTFKVCADTIDLEADSLLVNGAEMAQIRIATVTLTDAQIKALPTTPFEVLAAVPSNVLHVISVLAVLDATAGAYTNVSTVDGAQVVLQYNSGVGDYATSAMYQAAPGTAFSDFFAAAHKASWRPVAAGYTDWAAANGLLTYSEGDHTNTNIALAVSNGASGNFTGGNAANSLTVTVAYMVLP
ncbi:MAG TPA: hypothetical protein VN903_30165 [Polyangia bacterium]|nr:hypothetical protein [Polyangia bacterium]